jgi:hypothetical protein
MIMARIAAIFSLFFVLGCFPYSTTLQDDTSTNSNYFKNGIPSDAYLEKDKWESDRTNIKSENGVTEGYIKPDRWESDRLNVYDKYGRPTGIYIKKDRWQPERWNIKGNTK